MSSWPPESWTPKPGSLSTSAYPIPFLANCLASLGIGGSHCASHLAGKEPVSKLSVELGIQPSQITLDSLSTHVVADDAQPLAELLTSLKFVLRQRFGISHATIEIEPTDLAEHRALI
jgi:hypothetical protein